MAEFNVIIRPDGTPGEETMNEYRTTFKEQKTTVLPEGLIIVLFIGILFGFAISTLFEQHLYPLSQLSNDYFIEIKGVQRDIRNSPHWDLIKIAWKNDNNQLLLKPWGHGTRKPFYNWLEDIWVE